MLNWTRLVITSVFFVTSLDGLATIYPCSLQRLAADWKSLFGSLMVNPDGSQKQQELERTGAVLLENLQVKEVLAAHLVQGKFSLRQVARAFRVLDHKVPLLAHLKRDQTEEVYCKEVISFMEGYLRRQGAYPDQQFLHRLKTEMENQALPSRLDRDLRLEINNQVLDGYALACIP